MVWHYDVFCIVPNVHPLFNGGDWNVILCCSYLATGEMTAVVIMYKIYTIITKGILIVMNIMQRKEFEHYPGALIRVSSALDQQQKIRSFLKSKALERPLSSLADSGLLLEEADK
jgi:hypothetical protein